MLHTNIDAPPIPEGTADQKCQQIYRYLYALAETLQNVFDSIGTQDGMDDIKKRIAELEKAAGLARKTISG